MSDIAAVTFDLDGTLYDSRAFRRAYLWRVGTAVFRARKIRRVKEAFRGEVFPDGVALRTAMDEALATALHTEIPFARDLETQLYETAVVEVLQKIGPRPDARGAVQQLLDAGLRVGVVSDYAPDQKLAALGLADLPWSVRLGADQLGALKPYPRVFEAAATALALPPERVVHVGDRTDTDVQGAKAAGMGWRHIEGGPECLVACVADVLKARC